MSQTRQPRYHLDDKVLVPELIVGGQAYRECEIAQEPNSLHFDGEYQILCNHLKPETENKLETYGETELFGKNVLPESITLVDKYSKRLPSMFSHEEKRLAQLLKAKKQWEARGNEQKGLFPQRGASRRNRRRRQSRRRRQNKKYSRRR